MPLPGDQQRDAFNVVTTQVDDHPRLAASLVDRLFKQRAAMIEQLAKNRAKDFPEYKYLCGQIDGLDIAINFAQEAKRKLEA